MDISRYVYILYCSSLKKATRVAEIFRGRTMFEMWALVKTVLGLGLSGSLKCGDSLALMRIIKLLEKDSAQLSK